MGGANISSIVNAFDRLNVPIKLSNNRQEIEQASHLILPGVGDAKFCMESLKRFNLIDTILNFKRPLLGICVGMHLLFEHSEEGNTECLGIIKGKVKKFDNKQGFPVPHMGWNQ